MFIKLTLNDCAVFLLIVCSRSQVPKGTTSKDVSKELILKCDHLLLPKAIADNAFKFPNKLDKMCYSHMGGGSRATVIVLGEGIM